MYIDGTNKRYSVDREGAIYSLLFGKKRVLKKQKSRDGYDLVGLRSSTGVKTTRSVHRIVAIAFLPNPNNLPEVNHKNGDKRDNRVDNLEWVSRSENVFHSYKIGTSRACEKGKKGEENVSAKLTALEVEAIRAMYKTGNFYQKEIAKLFKVSRALVGYIVAEKIWQNQK